MKNLVIAGVVLLHAFLFSCNNPTVTETGGIHISSDKLFELADSGQWDEVMRSLEFYDGDIDALDSYSVTLLYLSCYQSNEKIVQRIIDKGASVNKVMKSGSTPLHAAAYKDNVEVAKTLIQAGVYINICDEDRNTPLHIAARRNSIGVMRVLLDSGANSNSVNDTGWTPLLWSLLSSRKPSLETIELLLRHGADPNYKNPAPILGDSSIFILERVPSPIGATAIEIAEDGNYTDIIGLLKKYGAK